MEPDEETLSLRPFQAVIWGTEPESVGIRAVYYAADCDAAKKLAIQDHGEHCTFSIWNEEDAEQPSSKRNAKQVNSVQPATAVNPKAEGSDKSKPEPKEHSL